MLSSTPSSTTSQQHYLMYEEDNTTADQKINEDRMILNATAATENLMASSGSGSGSGSGSVNSSVASGGTFGMGIGMNSGATTGHGGRLPGYWQHAATSAAGYWSSLFDSWTNNSIGSQSLSLAWDDNRNQ
ncbi:uncharacterized protein DDB_G0282077-like [Cotesia glomerata]|nr:uncharacterized protein DDB_G0282077-like [Cotesia glomerata]